MCRLMTNHRSKYSYMIICLLLGSGGRGPLVYVALKPSAIAHVIWMRISEPTETGERGQVPFSVAAVVIGAGRVVRRRWPWRRSESSGHPTAARQRTCSTQRPSSTRDKKTNRTKKPSAEQKFVFYTTVVETPPPSTQYCKQTSSVIMPMYAFLWKYLFLKR